MDKKEKNTKKRIVAQAIINKIEDENQTSEIKTDVVEGYQKPEKIVKKDDDQKEYIPDVIAKTDSRSDLYEIELDEKNYIPEKWKLFSLYSLKTKGSFNLVVPEKNLDRIKGLLKENSIKAKIIYFA